jgi:hypothetical protein
MFIRNLPAIIDFNLCSYHDQTANDSRLSDRQIPFVLCSRVSLRKHVVDQHATF